MTRGIKEKNSQGCTLEKYEVLPLALQYPFICYTSLYLRIPLQAVEMYLTARWARE
jgi:hypothetical protein